jgi:hypothetical protein
MKYLTNLGNQQAALPAAGSPPPHPKSFPSVKPPAEPVNGGMPPLSRAQAAAKNAGARHGQNSEWQPSVAQ